MIFYGEDVMMRLYASIVYLLKITSGRVIKPLIYLGDVYIKIIIYRFLKKR